MELQQPETFIPRRSENRIPHLRLVQPGESIGSLSAPRGRAPSGKTQPARLPKAPAVEKEQDSSSIVISRRHQGAAAHGLRGIAPEHVEKFLNGLRGEALLVGALSYDLGLRLSQLRFLRVRDVNLVNRTLSLSEGARPIPQALFEDLREHIADKLCGIDTPLRGGNKRDQLLFSSGAFEGVLASCAAFFAAQASKNADEGSTADVGSSALTAHPSTEIGQKVRDNFLRVMGWFHSKRAAQRGGRIESPLGLFDKGPKIVRRERGGVVNSYYLWRAV